MIVKSERSETLDIAKGIAIILMVIGHCYSTEKTILTLIYGFHMPLFFMISGIIYGNKLGADHDYKFRIWNMGIRLMRPYLFWCFTFSLFLSLLQSISGTVGFSSTFFEYLLRTVRLQGVGSLWYLPCIFIVELIFILICKICRKALLPISLVLYLIAMIIKTDNVYLTILWRVFVGFGFFAVGYYGSVFIVWCKKKEILQGVRLIVIMIILLVLYVIFSLKNGMVSLVGLRFSNPLLYTVNAILGSLSLLLFSFLLASRVKARFLRTIIWFGQKTLFVLGLHQFIIETIRLADYKLFGNILPKLGLFEGIVFGTVVCVGLLLTSSIFEKLKNKISSHEKKEEALCRKSV